MRQMTVARLGPDGGWHFVCMGRDGGYPIGNCRDHEPHPTPEEARQCYTDWRRARVVFRDCSWSSCRVRDAENKRCPNPAKRYATVEGEYMGGHATVCQEHETFDVAVQLLRLDVPAGDAWVS